MLDQIDIVSHLNEIQAVLAFAQSYHILTVQMTLALPTCSCYHKSFNWASLRVNDTSIVFTKILHEQQINGMCITHSQKDVFNNWTDPQKFLHNISNAV